MEFTLTGVRSGRVGGHDGAVTSQSPRPSVTITAPSIAPEVPDRLVIWEEDTRDWNCGECRLEGSMNGGSVVDVEATATSRPEYGNWVSTRFAVAAGAWRPACWRSWPWRPARGRHRLGWPACGWGWPPLWPRRYVAAYFGYARHLLGGGAAAAVQARVQGLVLERLRWDGQGRDGPGRALDIGCGNGPLTIALALTGSPRARGDRPRLLGRELGVLARRLRATRRVGRFRRARELPPGERGGPALCRRQLRSCRQQPLLPRGPRCARQARDRQRGAARARARRRLCLQDLFRLKGAYNEIDDLLAAIRAWGVAEVEYIDTGNASSSRRRYACPSWWVAWG